MIPTKFQVNLSFGSGEKAKNRFSRWRPWQPSWISEWNDLVIFDVRHLDASYPSSFKSISISVQEKKQKIDFQDGCNGDRLGFPIETIFAIFELQVTAMLPVKFRVHWPFGSGEEAKNRYQDGHHGGHLGFPIGTSHPKASYPGTSELTFRFRSRSVR